MKFAEINLEQAVIELFETQQIPHVHGTIHEEEKTKRICPQSLLSKLAFK